MTPLCPYYLIFCNYVVHLCSVLIYGFKFKFFKNVEDTANKLLLQYWWSICKAGGIKLDIVRAELKSNNTNSWSYRLTRVFRLYDMGSPDPAYMSRLRKSEWVSIVSAAIMRKAHKQFLNLITMSSKLAHLTDFLGNNYKEWVKNVEDRAVSSQDWTKAVVVLKTEVSDLPCGEHHHAASDPKKLNICPMCRNSLDTASHLFSCSANQASNDFEKIKCKIRCK